MLGIFISSICCCILAASPCRFLRRLLERAYRALYSALFALPSHQYRDGCRISARKRFAGAHCSLASLYAFLSYHTLPRRKWRIATILFSHSPSRKATATLVSDFSADRCLAKRSIANRKMVLTMHHLRFSDECHRARLGKHKIPCAADHHPLSWVLPCRWRRLSRPSARRHSRFICHRSIRWWYDISFCTLNCAVPVLLVIQQWSPCLWRLRSLSIA